MRVVVATRNRHKVVEIRALLAESMSPAFDLVTIDYVAPDAVLREDEATFEGNALAKARQASRATGLPAIADDSGIEVDALDGAPGVISARYAGEPCDDGRNNDKLLLAMETVADDRRAARYRCAAAFVDPVRAIELVRFGACEGRVLRVPRGSGGFGYDPLFFLDGAGADGRGRTMAEITLDEKNRLSHRAAAFRALAAAMRDAGVGGG